MRLFQAGVFLIALTKRSRISGFVKIAIHSNQNAYQCVTNRQEMAQ